MLSGGLEQIFHTKSNVDLIVHLSYPFRHALFVGCYFFLLENTSIQAGQNAKAFNLFSRFLGEKGF